VLIQRLIHGSILLALMLGFHSRASSGFYNSPAAVIGYYAAPPAADVSAYELILAVNSSRASYGLPALVEDPIINAVAQSTAETMASAEMSWHIGNVSGRLASAGYGGGAKVWATENFAVGNHSIDEIMVIWSDASHMIPMVNPAYCNVGAGVARSPSGRNYYVLQAAYTATHACGEYKSPVEGASQSGGSSSSNTGSGSVSQIIAPVKIATPDADGRIYHVVEAGQSFWAVAIAYKITINDLETWNNLSRNSVLKVGQRLFIPGSNTEGYATPTPAGMVLVAEAGTDGKIIHVVQPYQALSMIAQAYKVPLDTILNLNGIQAEWPLQIGQELLISTGDMSPQQSLNPAQQLTPAGDGRYYHTVNSGETLVWIANQYKVSLADLMAWNGLTSESIIFPNQKLVLLITPPAVSTSTASPTRAIAAVATLASPTPESPRLASPSPSNMVKENGSSVSGSKNGLILGLIFALGLGGLLLITISFRRR
jgi:LysM repeat protein